MKVKADNRIKKSEMQRMTESYPDTPGVTAALENLKQAREALEEEVQSLQESCSHEDTVPVVEYDSDYSNRYGMRPHQRGSNIFVGEFCLECHKFEPRKEGLPSKVCYMCGGDMRPDGRFRTGPSSGGSSYKCEECGHIYDIT